MLLILYRPGFSGHKILLCGRPDWGECGEPFAPGLSRAAGGILLQQPVLVIARDEGPDRGANLLGIAEDPAAGPGATPRRPSGRRRRRGAASPGRRNPAARRRPHRSLGSSRRPSARP